MSRDKTWYCRTSWTEADRAAFEARNLRSRGVHSKAQYIRIQADTLRRTENPHWIRSALKLLEDRFRDLPPSTDSALAFECAGQCCEQLGDSAQAIAYYELALHRERVYPGVGSNACFRLGRLVVEQKRAALYDLVLSAFDRFGRVAFPYHAYETNAVRAIIAHERGDFAQARGFARTALDAAAIRDAGWGRDGLGVVNEKDQSFLARITEIATL